MYVATASPRPKRSAFDSSRGGMCPVFPPPWIRHCGYCFCFLAVCFSMATTQRRLLFEGGIYFVGKPADSNDAE